MNDPTGLHHQHPRWASAGQLGLLEVRRCRPMSSRSARPRPGLCDRGRPTCWSQLLALHDAPDWPERQLLGSRMLQEAARLNPEPRPATLRTRQVARARAHHIYPDQRYLPHPPEPRYPRQQTTTGTSGGPPPGSLSRHADAPALALRWTKNPRPRSARLRNGITKDWGYTVGTARNRDATETVQTERCRRLPRSRAPSGSRGRR